MRIFISYARENQDFALEVRGKLIEWGYSTWIDIHDIPKGAYWPDEIDKDTQLIEKLKKIGTERALETIAKWWIKELKIEEKPHRYSLRSGS